MEQKYVVFKKKNWDRFMNEPNAAPIEGPLPEPIEDCFVIRFQDVLAGPGLHAYAGAAQTMIDGVMAHEQVIHGFLDTEPEAMKLREALQRVRDAAFEAANIADNYPGKKVPD